MHNFGLYRSRCRHCASIYMYEGLIDNREEQQYLNAINIAQQERRNLEVEMTK